MIDTINIRELLDTFVFLLSLPLLRGNVSLFSENELAKAVKTRLRFSFKYTTEQYRSYKFCEDLKKFHYNLDLKIY